MYHFYEVQSPSANFATENSGVLQCHQQTQTIRYECSKCDSLFTSRIYLRHHEATAHNRLFHCPFCPILFSNKPDFKTHVTAHTEKRYLPCSFCKKVFHDVDEYAVHVKMHREPFLYSCDECPAMFAQLSSLRGHSAVHSKKKFVHIVTSISKHLICPQQEQTSQPSPAQNLSADADSPAESSQLDSVSAACQTDLPSSSRSRPTRAAAVSSISNRESSKKKIKKTLAKNKPLVNLEKGENWEQHRRLRKRKSALVSNDSSSPSPENSVETAAPVTEQPSHAPKPAKIRQKRGPLRKQVSLSGKERTATTSSQTIISTCTSTSRSIGSDSEITSTTEQTSLPSTSSEKIPHKHVSLTKSYLVSAGKVIRLPPSPKKSVSSPVVPNKVTSTGKQSSRPPLLIKVQRKRRRNLNSDGTANSVASSLLTLTETSSDNTTSTSSSVVPSTKTRSSSIITRKTANRVRHGELNLGKTARSSDQFTYVESNKGKSSGDQNTLTNEKENLNEQNSCSSTKNAKTKPRIDDNYNLRRRIGFSFFYSTPWKSPNKKSVRRRSSSAFYVCSFCKRVFSNFRSLEKHKFIHAEKRGYPCDKCGGVFGGQGNLVSHQKSTHCVQI